jgi:hypothetical protein
MESVSLLNLPVHGPTRPGPAPPILQAARVRREPLGPNPHHLLLIGVRQADTFLRGRGTSLDAATRADLKALMGEQLGQELLPVAPAMLRGQRLRPKGVVPLCARRERSPYGGQRADLEQVEYRARERPLDILAVAEHGLAVDGQQMELLELPVGEASPLDALGSYRLLEDAAAGARPEGDILASGRHLEHGPGRAQPVAVRDHAPVHDHLPEPPAGLDQALGAAIDRVAGEEHAGDLGRNELLDHDAHARAPLNA